MTVRSRLRGVRPAARRSPGPAIDPGTEGRRLWGGHGFTLIELIITLVILSVMTALAIPAFLRDPVRTDMDDAQSRLETLFRMARDSAVRSASEVTVAFDSVTGYAWLESAAVPPPPAATAAGNGITLRAGGTFGGGSTLGRGAASTGTATGVAQPIGLRPGITLQTFRARALFTFSPTGTVTGDSLVVRGPNGEARHITLEPWTGNVLAR